MHQSREVTQYASVPRRPLFWDPRIGKTRASLALVDTWLAQGYRRILIAAPKTVCASVWGPEIYESFRGKHGKIDPRIVSGYSGTLKDREGSIRALTFEKEKGIPSFVICNADALHHLKVTLIKWDPEIFIIDELHEYKSPSSQRHRAAYAIASRAKIVRGLTGTCTPKNYGDLYGQWKILDSSVFGTSYQDFKNRYIVMDPTVPYPKITGYKDVDDLKAKAFPPDSVVRRSEVFEIPSIQEVVRKITLPKPARTAYDQAAGDHVAEINGKLLAFDHALARLTYLQQLASGYIPARYTGVDEDDAAAEKWVHDEKIDAAIDEIDDILASGEKVVVFHRFLAEGERLLTKLGPNKAATLTGKTPAHERQARIERFNKTDELPVLIIQEKVGSVGISLVGANYAIFLSSGYEYVTHTQARDRIFKPGADKKLTYIYIQAKGTVDAWVRRLIRTKETASEALLAKGSPVQAFLAAAYSDEKDDDE